MVIADPEGQLQTFKQLRSSGKIKIHQHSSVITLLLSDWLTIRHEVPRPNNKEEKAFHDKTTFPLTVWIYAPRQSCISPPFHHRHSSPESQAWGAARRFTNDKLLLGLLSKISAGQREWSWKRGEEEVLGSQTKPAERLQIKRGAFLPVQTIQKKPARSQMAVRWKRRSAPQRSPALGLLGQSCFFVI